MGWCMCIKFSIVAGSPLEFTSFVNYLRMLYLHAAMLYLFQIETKDYIILIAKRQHAGGLATARA